jgi:exportin-2 (importin alpha re-exporter)
MQLCIAHLESPSYIVHTYAALAIERLLTVRVPGPTSGLVPVFSKTDVKPFLQPTLANLFKVLESPDSRENDYVMKGMVHRSPHKQTTQVGCFLLLLFMI